MNRRPRRTIAIRYKWTLQAAERDLDNPRGPNCAWRVPRRGGIIGTLQFKKTFFVGTGPEKRISTVMTRHMLRRLEHLSSAQLAELSTEVTAEHHRRATEVWGVAASELTPEPVPNTIPVEVNTKKVIRYYVDFTADSQT